MAAVWPFEHRKTYAFGNVHSINVCARRQAWWSEWNGGIKTHCFVDDSVEKGQTADCARRDIFIALKVRAYFALELIVHVRVLHEKVSYCREGGCCRLAARNATRRCYNLLKTLLRATGSLLTPGSALGLPLPPG